MTCGIYKLNFKGTDKVYIGRSTNIENRYKQHISKYSIKSKKMEKAFQTYGTPSYEILKECESTDLANNENYFISFYNSFYNGFNSLEFSEDICALKGAEHPHALYTKDTYINIFEYLVLTNLTYLDISILLDVSKNVVNSIASGNAHKWLEAEYPFEYNNLLKNNRNSAIFRDISYPTIIDPLGNKYTVTNTNEFATKYKLDQAALHKVLTGKNKQHKGWKLENYVFKVYPKVISPEGVVHEITIPAKIFALNNNLLQGGLQKVLAGTAKIHRGWKLYTPEAI